MQMNYINLTQEKYKMGIPIQLPLRPEQTDIPHDEPADDSVWLKPEIHEEPEE